MIEQAKSITIMIKIADDAGIPLVEPKRVYSVYPKYRRRYGVPYFMFLEKKFFCIGSAIVRVVELCVFSFSDGGFDRQVENFGKNKIVTDYYDKILEGANLKQTITLNV